MVNYLPETCTSIPRLHYTYKLSTFHPLKWQHTKYRFNLNPFYQLHYIGKFLFVATELHYLKNGAPYKRAAWFLK